MKVYKFENKLDINIFVELYQDFKTKKCFYRTDGMIKWGEVTYSQYYPNFQALLEYYNDPNLGWYEVSYNQTIPIQTNETLSVASTTKHKCTEDWMEVYKNGCKCGGI